MRLHLWLYSVLITLCSLCVTSVHAKDWIYTTVNGDNLWNLSEEHLDKVGRFKQIQRINNIQNPRQMQPGTRLRIPLKWIRSNPVPAQVHAFTGHVILHKANAEKQQLQDLTLQIHLGDKLQTGPDSNAAIQFADRTLITLHENSLIQFDHLSAHGTTGMVDSRMKLLQGRMDTRATPAKGPGSRFEIHTPSAISAVRGTEYRTAVSVDQASSHVEVLHGKVAVSGAGKRKLVKAGFGTQVTTGAAPTKPVKLLPAPSLNEIAQPIRQVNKILSWAALLSADAFRVEISKSEHFETLLWQQRGVHNRTVLPDLPDGKYYIRVRGIDARGLEGINRTLALQLDARPLPPILLYPAPQQVFRGVQPELKWSVPENSQRFYLEIATDETFQHPVLQRTLDTTAFSPDNLAIPGQYFWRLSSISATNEYGPPSTSGSWKALPVPSKVDAEMATADDGQLTAHWPVDHPDQRFQLQIALDEKFTQLEVDTTLDKNSYQFAPVKNQTRYLRLRAIEKDGYLGPWGAAQKIPPIIDYTPLTIFGAAVMILLI